MTNGLKITPTMMSIGANEFSTANRYPRQVALLADAIATMVEGPSMSVSMVPSGGSAQAVSWRFECGDLTKAGGYSGAGIATGFAVDKPIGV